MHVLIDAGSDVNALDSSGNTPLHVSAGSGHVDVVRLLLDNGADLYAVDKEGLTPADVLNCLHKRRLSSSLTKGYDTALVHDTFSFLKKRKEKKSLVVLGKNVSSE